MKPTPKQTDHYLGHTTMDCPTMSDPDATCICLAWQCASCGQQYGEAEGHTCPAREVFDPRD